MVEVEGVVFLDQVALEEDFLEAYLEVKRNLNRHRHLTPNNNIPMWEEQIRKCTMKITVWKFQKSSATQSFP